MGKKPFMGRDHLLLKLIAGATKAGVHTDRKKEADKAMARKKEKDKASQEQIAPPTNGMMVAELKYLRAQVAARDQRIAELTKEIQELRVVNFVDLVACQYCNGTPNLNCPEHGSGR